jgi:hypothetical protein
VSPPVRTVAVARIHSCGESRPQRGLKHDPGMNDSDPDDALLTAAERARQAEERFVETPPQDPTLVPKAEKVYQRAEEVDDLAHDAADEAAPPQG